MKGKITYWLLSVVIFMKIFTTLDATGKIAVRLTSFKNENYFDFNGYCCESTRWTTSCTQSCDSAFKLCFDTALGFDTLSYCAYGSVGYIGNIPDRYITFRDHSLFSKPFKASFKTWPGSSKLKIGVIDRDGSLADSDMVDYLWTFIITKAAASESSAPWTSRLIKGTRKREPTTLLLEFAVYCDPGWKGADCNECAVNHCKNGGTCSYNSAKRQKHCTCPVGYTGTSCEVSIDDCASGPCLSGGNCFDSVNSYTCQCRLGFKGTNCEINIDDCASSPCKYGATCIDGVHSYTCRCAPGFLGTHCENFDLCYFNPCKNGAKCVDNTNSYSCQCREGFQGSRCETATCTPNPCKNNSYCQLKGGTYECFCTNGYYGTQCELKVTTYG